MKYAALSCSALLAVALFAAAPPEAEISSSVLHAKLYLPDAEQGYYRATRFDWSGVIASLEWNGHNYFGQWFPRYDPKLHDAIMGPVEEFLTRGEGLGYQEAKPGESFVKIGVGAVRKPEEKAFRQFNTYEITNPGKWDVHKRADSVEFTQTLPDTLGYAYVYTKTLRLAAGKPQLILEHRLRNTGRKTIESSVYEHNFYMLDGLPSGPDVVVKFPFEVHAKADLAGLAETRGMELAYLQELPQGKSVYSELQGYGDTAKDYDIRVENRKAGIGVRQTSDRPLSKLVFWSIRTTACPEAYIDMHIEPGKDFTWRISYDFYKLP
jgi:hypothetical protein